MTQLTPEQVRDLIGIPFYPGSLAFVDDAAFFLTRGDKGKQLGILAPAGAALLARFDGQAQACGGRTLLLCPLTHPNAVLLRSALPWLKPQPLGLRTSAGTGDRLGLATPGHVRAARAVGGIAMIFAQQSIREMKRTNRSPDEVMDDATWGVFQEGWREGVGADADHLMTPDDVHRCVAAGFTFYTIDPGEHVDSAADTDGEAALRHKYQDLPWDAMETDSGDLLAAYHGRRFDIGPRALTLDEPTLVRAAVKYGRAVAHVKTLYRLLLETFPGGQGFELEASVDETETPTTHAEHLFIAVELRRLGVRWVSLAPRYVGRFEKGADYIPSDGLARDDMSEFKQDFAGHADIARAFGPYKLSLHSGSDKFSVYAIAAEQTRGLIHLKTAGTSYLEALRATAGYDPALFREILSFSIERFPTDRASYHISAELRNVPAPESLKNAELPDLLEHFDTRQVLHVTYGSVLANSSFKGRFFDGLKAHEDEYYAALERHFIRHLRPMKPR